MAGGLGLTGVGSAGLVSVVFGSLRDMNFNTSDFSTLVSLLAKMVP
ncbi:hypothetical protein HUT03_00310 [Candidatus Liberibacter africanus]|nr:hypothetical protein [Candidatus Liberibacter africanus]QTP63604.1 hypothetical protein HUT03_00310 [Candidatus Liberibacter africanus]